MVERFYDRMQQRNAGAEPPVGPATERRMSRALHRRTERPTARRKLFYYGAAAALLLFFGVAALLSRSGPTTVSVATAAGEQRAVHLPDGSQVLLHANSHISYGEKFGAERNVTLHGTAFFDVARDTLRPFTVRSGAVLTRVLGTSFTIRENTDGGVHVKVSSGTVRTSYGRDTTGAVVLTRGDEVRYDGGGQPQVYRTTGARAPAKDNVIQFADHDLAYAIAVIARRYGIRIELADPRIAERRISGKFRNESVANVLTSLAILADLDVERRAADHYIINEKDTRD